MRLESRKCDKVMLVLVLHLRLAPFGLARRREVDRYLGRYHLSISLSTALGSESQSWRFVDT